MSEWRKQVEKEFVQNINDTYTLNLAISILEDREDFREEKEDYKSRIDKAIEYLGIDEEILETCEIYDVNGIEVYKILQGNKWNEVERAYLDDKPIGSDKE